MAKILLVDKNKDIRDFIGRFFTERNFEVLDASNGLDALLIIERDFPDIVLLELKMPDIDGIEMIKRVKKLNQDTKMIVVTDIDDVEIMSQARRLGVLSYLTKPIVLSELIDIVMKNIGRKQMFFKLIRASQ